jgi:hypothetical protein
LAAYVQEERATARVIWRSFSSGRHRALPPQAASAFEEPIFAPSIVELCLLQGRRLRFDSGIESATLMRLIRSIEGA